MDCGPTYKELKESGTIPYKEREIKKIDQKNKSLVVGVTGLKREERRPKRCPETCGECTAGWTRDKNGIKEW